MAYVMLCYVSVGFCKVCMKTDYASTYLYLSVSNNFWEYLPTFIIFCINGLNLYPYLHGMHIYIYTHGMCIYTHLYKYLVVST